MKKIFTLCALMLASLPSWSFTPESGMYWNADEPGSGYTFEIQDNFFFGVFYVYDDLGFPYWYTTSGFLDGNAYVEGDIYISEDGPCLACAYTPNNTFTSSLGKAKINFITETTATINMLGQNIFVERFNFFLGNELQKMRGEWQAVLDVSGVDQNAYPFSADALVFEQTETFDGIDMVTGCRSESTVYYIGCTDNANFYHSVAATFDASLGILSIVVDDDDDHFLLYEVNVGTNQFDGEAYYYPKGTNPDTRFDGYIARGFRTTSKSFIDTGVGPNKTTETQVVGPRSINLPVSETSLIVVEDERKKALNETRKKLELYLIEGRGKKAAAK